MPVLSRIEMGGGTLVGVGVAVGDEVARGVADAAGRRNPLPEPDDPRERIDHAESVAGRTGDQQAAIIGTEVERRIDAGSRRMSRAGRAAATGHLSIAAT